MKLELFRGVTDEIRELYEASFPACERRSWYDIDLCMADDAFRPYVISNNEEGFVGLFWVWEFGELCYMEYLATRPELRGKGYGGKAMDAMLELQRNHLCVLEIEPPVDDLTRRRQKLYERHGWITNHWPFTHPSYQKPAQPHQLVIMSHSRVLTEGEFELFKRKTFTKIRL